MTGCFFQLGRTGKKKEERPPYFRYQLLSEKKADSTSSVIAYTDNKSPTEVKLISVFAKNRLKSGTVTMELEKALAEIKAGKVE